MGSCITACPHGGSENLIEVEDEVMRFLGPLFTWKRAETGTEVAVRTPGHLLHSKSPSVPSTAHPLNENMWTYLLLWGSRSQIVLLEPNGKVITVD